MQTLHWFILGGLVLAILVVLKTLLASPDPGKQPCTVRQHFCTRQRRKFWQALQKAVGQDYLVLPHVPLAALLAAPEGSGTLEEWLRRRWVDFAILHVGNLTPAAVVQVERERSDSMWKQGRDATLTALAEQTGLTLLWLPSDNYQHVELLRHALAQAKARAKAMKNEEEFADGTSALDI